MNATRANDSAGPATRSAKRAADEHRGTATTASSILRLQQQAGNEAVAQLLLPALIAAEPSDLYDHEADQLGGRVLEMKERSDTEAILGKSDFPSAIPDQRDPRDHIPPTRPIGHSHTAVGGAPGPQAGHLAGPGIPLTDQERAFFEPRFGTTFGDVRIHVGEPATDSAEAVSASAYTLGSHIVFNANRYEPDTDRGQRLLAHELAHVVQQSSRPSQLAVTRTGGPLVQRSRETYVAAMQKKPEPDWQLAAEHLNGESPAWIKQVLKNLSPYYRAKLHQAARVWPGVDSNIAQLTEADYLKFFPEKATSTRQAGEAKGPSAKRDKGETTAPSPNYDAVRNLIVEKKYGDAFRALNALDDKELSRTVKALHDDEWLSSELGIHFEEAAKGDIDWKRIRLALDDVEATEKERYIDNFMNWKIDPASFRRNPEREKQGKWNVRLILTYALTPPRSLVIYADDVGDESGPKDEQVPRTLRVVENGILVPPKLNRGTTPKLWAAKKKAIEDIETQNYEFVNQAFAAAEMAMGAAQLSMTAASMLPATGSMAVSSRRIPVIPGRTSGQGSAVPGADIGEQSSEAGAKPPAPRLPRALDDPSSVAGHPRAVQQDLQRNPPAMDPKRTARMREALRNYRSNPRVPKRIDPPESHGQPVEGGTVAVAQTDIPGLDSQNFPGASAKALPPELKGAQGTTGGKVLTPSSPVASNHGEHVALENVRRGIDLALETGKVQRHDLQGRTIYLLVEQEPCTSCTGVIQQFSALYPELTIEVRSLRTSRAYIFRGGTLLNP